MQKQSYKANTSLLKFFHMICDIRLPKLWNQVKTISPPHHENWSHLNIEQSIDVWIICVSGKYAMRDLVQKLPSGNPQRDHGTSDDTIAAVLATLNEVIKKHPEFSRYYERLWEKMHLIMSSSKISLSLCVALVGLWQWVASWILPKLWDFRLKDLTNPPTLG